MRSARWSHDRTTSEHGRRAGAVRLRVGTRGSALALAQTRSLVAALTQHDRHEVELVPITTRGDRSRASLVTLARTTSTGVFVAALREALLAGEVDAVVHSCKDLPTTPHPDLELVALPPRADARDVVVTRDGGGLGGLPIGARVGTGSPRRRAQLLAARADLEVVDIRGNVDTRLRRVLAPDTPHQEALAAVVLAAAGLARLGLADVPAQPQPLLTWPTAPAQGALAVEVRRVETSAQHRVRAVFAALDDPETRRAATAEREVLALLEAGCAAPLGVSTVAGDLVAHAYAPDGSRRLQAHATLAPGAAGRVVADLLEQGAAELMG